METRDSQTYAIIGAAMAVHRELGHGFSEPVYQAALEQELLLQHIPHEREVELRIMYRGFELAPHYQVDFICYESIIVELKALQQLTSREDSQVINYLKASRLHKALLINFGNASLEHKRLVYNLRDPLQ